jgi:hypothetical protein
MHDGVSILFYFFRAKGKYPVSFASSSSSSIIIRFPRATTTMVLSLALLLFGSWDGYLPPIDRCQWDGTYILQHKVGATRDSFRQLRSNFECYSGIAERNRHVSKSNQMKSIKQIKPTTNLTKNNQTHFDGKLWYDHVQTKTNIAKKLKKYIYKSKYIDINLYKYINLYTFEKSIRRLSLQLQYFRTKNIYHSLLLAQNTLTIHKEKRENNDWLL